MSTELAARHDGPWRNMPAYGQIIRSRMRTAVTYRQNVVFTLGIVIVQIFILRKVWTALYGDAGTVGGIPLTEMLVYLTLANLQGWAVQDSTVSSYLWERIREGRIAFDLLRPAGFIPQIIAQLVGSALMMLMFTVTALPVVAVIGTLGAPASPAALGLWLVSLLCGIGVAIMMNLMICLSAFWTTEINGIMMLFSLVSQFMAGVFVPLSYFPGLLRTLAEHLPFQATTYTPVAIYVGQLEGTEAIRAIGVQLLWIVLLALAARVVWSRALHRVVVQGG
ncbi:ABC transporter permease [Micromonospora sp. NPDC092111]|uniref:ABC transporter permease n=1 Tax=Micromonospora sp. NPDC092111 TaxID=3364289 RepID=UPI0038149D0D